MKRPSLTRVEMMTPGIIGRGPQSVSKMKVVTRVLNDQLIISTVSLDKSHEKDKRKLLHIVKKTCVL